MSIYVNERYRIKRSAEQESLMKLLTDSKVFSSYANILAISAVVGYLNKQYVSISKAATDGVQIINFSDEEKDLIDIIAYCHSKNQNILKSDDKYEIFESYANGGFPILLDKLEISLDQTYYDQKSLLIQLYTLLATNDLEVSGEISIEDMILVS